MNFTPVIMGANRGSYGLARAFYEKYGVKTIILPRRNMQDLDELPENIRKEMQFIPVEHLDDVLKLALEDKNE